MTILALDTSGTTASAALINEYIILAESSVTLADLKATNRKTHSETLMPMVDQLFNITGFSPQTVDAIACTCGPGSFTGLRIGAATAKGLAFGLNKPLIAVPTLDAMAYNISSISPRGTYVVPMMDARRSQVYTALYLDGMRKTDYMALPVEDLLKMICGYESVIFLGDGAEVYRDIIGIGCFAPPCHNRPRAACVGTVALTIKPAHESEFSLLYIRKPQAEREREENLKCSK